MPSGALSSLMPGPRGWRCHRPLLVHASPHQHAMVGSRQSVILLQGWRGGVCVYMPPPQTQLCRRYGAQCLTSHAAKQTLQAFAS